MKGAIVHLKSEPHASIVRFEWFENILGEAECQIGEANLCALSLEEKICKLEAEGEL